MQFGPYRLDAETGELWKAGVRLRLQDQPFRVLLALLDKPGELVTREDLRQRLWPDDTYVDFDHALTTAVKKLRRALGDSALRPHYIETLPRRGYRFVGELRSDQDASGASEAAANPGLMRQRNLLAFAAAAMALLAVFAFLRDPDQVEGRVESRTVRKFSFSAAVAGSRRTATAAISPDGRHIAYIGGEDRSIWIRDIDAEEPRRLDRTVGARGVFWSPDSQFLGFAQGSALRSVSIHGGPLTELCQLLDDSFFGGAWEPGGDEIYFAAGSPPAIFRVAARGGQPEQAFDQVVTEAGGGNFEPAFVYGVGRRRLLIFTAGGPGHSELFVQDLDNGEEKRLGQGRSAAFSPSGHILFQSGFDAGIWAVGFDPRLIETTGPATPVAENGGRPSVSSDGTLIYQDIDPLLPRQLTWRDRSGKLLGRIGPSDASVRTPAVSPDNRRVAYRRMEQGNNDIWVRDLETGVESRVSFDPVLDLDPTWSPDGRRLAWRSDRDGNAEIVSRAADGSSDVEVLVATTAAERPGDWLPNNAGMVYSRSDLEAGSDIWIMETGSPELQPRPLFTTPFNEFSPRLSPDGRLLAYCSDETGSPEVYVRAFPDGRKGWQVSRGGGCQPRWSRDSGELFYVDDHNGLVATRVTLGDALTVGERKTLFTNSDLGAASSRWTTYDVAPDGKRFILAEIVGEQTASGSTVIHIVENWFVDLERTL